MTSQKKPKTINPDDVDPSVYYYDEVYDDMQRTQGEYNSIENKVIKQKDSSKYIRGISEIAEQRKSEKAIRKFRKYARDREEAQSSGDLQGEDVYISKSYEKKLKEVHEAIKKQSRPDNNRDFNVFKKVKHNDEDKKTIKERPTGVHQESTGAKSNQHCDTQISDVKQDSATKDGSRPCLSKCTARMQRPTTIDERREYLRKALAKRTIGEVLEAAKERYRQRKSKF